MNNPQPQPSASMVSSHIRSRGKTVLIALGFGIVSAVPLAFGVSYGFFQIIEFFRLSTTWGLGALFVPVAILFYAFCANAFIMALATFITLTRSARPYVNALLIGLIINMVALLGGWGYNLIIHGQELSTLAAERNNDRVALSSDLSACAKATSVDYWRACIHTKITNDTTQATCEQQAAVFLNAGATTTECRYRHAANTGSTELCASLPVDGSAYARQRSCLYDALQKSWELNNRKTPLATVEGCATIQNDVNQQFCYSAALRQLDTTDEAARLACKNISTSTWLLNEGAGPQDRMMVEEKCGVTFSTP